MTLLARIATLNKFLGTGWTCGTFVVPFPAWPLGIPYVALSLLLLVLAGVGSNRCKRSRQPQPKRKQERTEQQRNETFVVEPPSPEDTTTTIATTDSEEETLALLSSSSPGQHGNYLSVSPPIPQREEDHHHCHSTSREELPSSPPHPFWSAFDVSQHLHQLMAAPSSQQQQHRATACLDGLRVGSMVWIMLGHVMAIQSSSGAGYANPANFLPPTGLTTTVPGQLLFSSRLAVDTFLSISGFLVVHVLYRKLPLEEESSPPSAVSSPTAATAGAATTRNGSLRHTVLHRYLSHLPSLLLARVVRILPLYAMCLGFYTQIAPQLGGGPFWHQWIDLLKPCHDAIWTNLLFVNNFLPLDRPTIDTCFYHSWYLAVDMQLFVLAPLLVFWFQFRPRQGLTVTASLFVASVAATVGLSYTRHWSVNTFDGAAVGRYDTEAYAKPHVRAQAYLAGMYVAMVLLVEQQQQEKQKKEAIAAAAVADSASMVQQQPPSGTTQRPRYTGQHHVAMTLALLGMTAVTFGTASGAYARRPCTYKEDPLAGDLCGSLWSPLTTWLYTGLSRTVWSVGVAVVMYLCVGRGSANGDRGNVVASILSWRCWTPLSQLSFGAYLIHPIVIFVWQLGDREKQTFRLLTFGMNYLSVCVVSYVAALVAAVLVELPCATLWKNLVVRRRRRGNSSSS